MHLLTIVYVNIEIGYSVDTADSFTGSRPFRRGTPSSPVVNCMY